MAVSCQICLLWYSQLLCKWSWSPECTKDFQRHQRGFTRQFTNGSGHEVPACYLELHEEGEVEISTCIWHKYKDVTAILKSIHVTK